jgi:selenide,water dikinase
MEGLEIHAATDVTGYGLLGHLYEMMAASGTSAEIRVGKTPLLSGARRLAERGVAPEGTRINVRNLKPRAEIEAGVTEEDFLLLCDAQTSGGLLVALPRESAEAYAARCRERGAISAAVIGQVAERGERLLRVAK